MVVLWLLLGGDVLAQELSRIDAAGLQEKLEKVVILDARPKGLWNQGHIPGAQSFSWEDYTRKDDKGIPYRLWPAAELANALGQLGIDEQTPVVVYGDADTSWGGEGWVTWVLSWLGHQGRIDVLDGGIQAWKKAGGSLQGEEVTSRPARTYQVRTQAQWIITTDQLRKAKNVTLVDTRSTMEWLLGRLPGAVHIPWKDMYEGELRRPLDGAAFRNLLEANDVKPQSTVIYYCTGGIRSAYAWMVHRLAGLPAAINYEGGTEAWGE